MKTYKYETHLHTCEASACGTSSGKEYIEVYAKAGYAGLFVTDHFFGGNTSVSREGEWTDRINAYCKGYETALAAAKDYNSKNNLTGTENEFKVFFGIEQTFNGDDYLLYGLNKDWLIAHPQIETMNHKELFAAINEAGGLMIQAHPFRLRGYMDAVHIHPREVHGFEIYNAGNNPDENELAALYAKKMDKSVTSGSDIHNVSCYPTMPNNMHVGGMEFDTPLKSVYDYAERIKNRQGTLIR